MSKKRKTHVVDYTKWMEIHPDDKGMMHSEASSIKYICKACGRDWGARHHRTCYRLHLQVKIDSKNAKSVNKFGLKYL